MRILAAVCPKQYKSERGYVAFITVLIISALLISLLVSMPLITTDTLKSSLAMEKGIKSRELAKSCSEIALLKIERDINYTGETLSIESGSCIIEVSDTTDGKNISIGANIDGYTKGLDIKIETLGKSINIISWTIN